jgi:hypothetical protein
MAINKAKPGRKKRIGRPPKSGAYSPLCRQEFLGEYPEIRRYIQGARDGLVDDQCRRVGVKSEDELPAAVRLMIDRQVSKLSLSRQIEVYIMRHGLLRRDRLKSRHVLEAEPIAVFWLNLQNSLDRGLSGLGFEVPKEQSAILTPLELAAEIDREKREREAAEHVAQVQGGDGKGPAQQAGGAEKTQLGAAQRESGQDPGDASDDQGSGESGKE